MLKALFDAINGDKEFERNLALLAVLTGIGLMIEITGLMIFQVLWTC